MGCSLGKPDIKASKKPANDTESKLEETTVVDNVDNLRLRAGQFIQHLKDPFSQKYRVMKELGSGNFGRVYQAQHKLSGEIRAVKEIDKQKAAKFGGSSKKFIAEVEILSRLDHPNILRIYEMFEDFKRFYIVSEMCFGGELFAYITSRTSLSEPIAAIIMRQVLSAVAYCHSKGIVHRDIKPENLLLDSPPTVPELIQIKLIDFGTSTLCANGDRLSQRLGTAYYIAPEVLEMNYNEKCDVWSCGVILYVLLCGFPPFPGNTDDEILKRVRTGKYSFQHANWRAISVEAKNLIKRMLVMEPDQRASALDCLSDPWIKAMGHSSIDNSEALTLSLTNLQSFNSERKLKQAFLTFISSQMMSKEEEKDISQTFRQLDTNGDGRLSREELIEAYLGKMPREEAEETVSRILAQVDADGSGYIDYSEFLLASANQQSLISKSNLEAAFAAFDRDHSGKISASELREMLTAAAPISDVVWAELIRQADQNGDGEIEFAEFAKMMAAAT